MSKRKMLSPRKYAEAIGRPYTTVMTWLQNGLLPEAEKLETPTGHVWAVPDGAKPPDLKPGPKKAANNTAKRKADPEPKATSLTSTSAKARASKKVRRVEKGWGETR